jgi:C1A family cysteine protease
MLVLIIVSVIIVVLLLLISSNNGELKLLYGASSGGTTQEEINAIAVSAAKKVVAPQTSAPKNITTAESASISAGLLNTTSAANNPVFNTILGSQLTLSQNNAMAKYSSQPLVTTAVSPISSNSNNSSVLANQFDSRSQWPGLISSVQDQLQCGSCWSFGVSSMVSDRIRIHSTSGTNQTSLHLDQNTPGNSYYDESNVSSDGGKLLSGVVSIRGANTLSQLSPWYLAGCDCCGFSFNLDPQIAAIFTSRSLCANCCSGSVIQYALIWVLLNGVVETACTKALVDYSCSTQLGCPVFRVKSMYRVNPYTTEIDNPATADPAILDANMKAMMLEIATNGPIAASMYVYPNFGGWDTRYVYDDLEGTTGPGGHTVVIIGYGSGPNKSGIMTPYWTVRNSWSTSWGNQGYFMIKRGVNFCRCERDSWTISPFSVYNTTPLPPSVNPFSSTASTKCSSAPSNAIVSPSPS